MPKNQIVKAGKGFKAPTFLKGRSPFGSAVFKPKIRFTQHKG
jgi:hypothetical protein